MFRPGIARECYEQKTLYRLFTFGTQKQAFFYMIDYSRYEYSDLISF